MNKPIIIIAIIIATLAIAAVGVLFWKNQKLTQEKAGVEKELAVLKSSDLAKEIELLSFKLKTTEKSLSESGSEVSRLGSRVQTLETNLNKIRPYLSAIDAVQKVVTGETGITKASVANADPKVAVLNDLEISGYWREAKDNIHFDGGRVSSYNQRFFGDAISAMVSRVLNLLP